MSLIPPEFKAIAILVAIAIAAAGLWGFVHHQRTLGKAEEVAAETQRALSASIANQAVSAQRVADLQEHAHAADVQASAARADVVAANSAGERLRVRLIATERRRTAADPAASSPGPAASAPGLVPYDVFEGVRGAAGIFAAYADQLSVSLDTCLASYSSLK